MKEAVRVKDCGSKAKDLKLYIVEILRRYGTKMDRSLEVLEPMNP